MIKIKSTRGTRYPNAFFLEAEHMDHQSSVQACSKQLNHCVLIRMCACLTVVGEFNIILIIVLNIVRGWEECINRGSFLRLHAVITTSKLNFKHNFEKTGSRTGGDILS